jgi:CTP synthase
MSPFEHGEVFVLNDGGEADLDLGNYERFLDIQLTRDHNITTGKVYQHVIMRERRGDYLGKTVQIVPHVTDAIQDWIQKVSLIPTDGDSKTPDICLIEVGGTVGDIESSVFLEAVRQFRYRVSTEDICLVHVSLVPVLGSVGEQKTKPTQHGVKELRSAGLSPDIIVCRSQEALYQSTKEKIAMFCQVSPQHVLGVRDVSNIYHVPLVLEEQNATATILHRLGLPLNKERPLLVKWKELAVKVDSFEKTVRIALVGKYTGLQDSYLSVVKALKHASIFADRDLQIEWVEAATLEKDYADKDAEKYNQAWEILKNVDGILVPGGFGDRGVEGKILTAKFARENKIPYLGVCLGMQVAVIEYCRSVLGLSKANSEEFDSATDDKVVVFMPEIDPTTMGGNMRLGERPTVLVPPTDPSHKSIAQILHGGASKVLERHRHRYEVNPKYVDRITAGGLIFSGVDDKKERMEIIELPRSVHPFYFATQYHPEFKSRPTRPSPPFVGFIMAASGQFEKL